MVDLERVKNVLRIDTDEDDEYLTLAMDAAKKYVIDAIGSYPEDARVDFLALALISNMYEQRTFTAEKTDEKPYMIKSMIHQLRFRYDEGSENSENGNST